MNTITLTKRLIWLAVFLPFMLSSCKKENTRPSLDDGKSTVINDLAGDTQASMGDNTPGKEKRPFYIFLFRFQDQKQIWIRTKADSAQWLKTNNWDIAFTGPYNSEVYVNKGNYEFNPGYGGPAKNAVILLKQSYQNVTKAPEDAEFDKSEVNKIGWASNEQSPGWYFYSLTTHLMQPIPDRTYVIRLTNGKFAKLQLLNVYKGNPPAVTDLNWPAPYLTFKYFVQEDGSRNLTTSN
jgi:hypothetical protein